MRIGLVRTGGEYCGKYKINLNEVMTIAVIIAI